MDWGQVIHELGQLPADRFYALWLLAACLVARFIWRVLLLPIRSRK
jgi:hypothetical protein